MTNIHVTNPYISSINVFAVFKETVDTFPNEWTSQYTARLRTIYSIHSNSGQRPLQLRTTFVDNCLSNSGQNPSKLRTTSVPTPNKRSSSWATSNSCLNRGEGLPFALEQFCASLFSIFVVAHVYLNQCELRLFWEFPLLLILFTWSPSVSSG